MSPLPPTREQASRGGKASGVTRRIKAAADPLTKGLLGSLLTYTTADWMDRFGLTGPSWANWRVIGRVLDGLPLEPAELATYHALTGRSVVPADLREILVLAGGGSGKTTFLAVQALRAACRGYEVRGVPRVLLLAFVKEQAGIAFELVSEFINGDRELRKLVTQQTTKGGQITLAHGVRIQTIASNFRQVRGYSIAAALCDEIAFWWNDDTNANPDVEVIRALRPRLGKVPGSRLLAATTMWTEEGWAYDTHERHYGSDGSAHVLVVKAPTLTLNPSFDPATIAIDEAEDPESAASEYGTTWRVAGGSLVVPAAYDACVEKGITERAPVQPLNDEHYGVAVDLSGGTGQDSAALAVFHVEVDEETGVEVAVQDLLEEWTPPFDPGAVVREIASYCARYGCTEVTGDQFSQGFAASALRECGIAYEVSARTTAECLIDSIAVLNTKRAVLLDHPGQRKQWLNLKRDYGSGGRPTVLEMRKHDDLAVVVARGIVQVLGLGIEPQTRPRAQFA